MAKNKSNKKIDSSDLTENLSDKLEELLFETLLEVNKKTPKTPKKPKTPKTQKTQTPPKSPSKAKDFISNKGSKIITSTRVLPKSSIVNKKTNLISPTDFFVSPKLPNQKGPNKLDLNLLFSDIHKRLKNITNILFSEKKLLKDKQEKDRKDKERQKAEKLESSLETDSIKEQTKDKTKKILSPLNNILDKILRFLFFTFLGSAFSGMMKWIGDPKNKKKLASIGRFLKDWWPALVAGYLLFGTSLGSLVRTITKMLLSFAVKAAIKNPIAAGAVAVGTAIAGATILSQKQKEKRDKEFTKKDPNYAKPNLFRDVMDMFGSGQHLTFSKGGQIPIDSIGHDGIISDNSGIDITGAGPDTQLIAAQPGEVVMNKATVDAIGADKLLALNKLYGGPNANKPKEATGIQMASTGGLIGKITKKTGNFMQNFMKGFNPGRAASAKMDMSSINIPEHRTPEVKAALRTLRFSEGTIKSKNSYDTLFGFGSAPIRKMTVDEVINMQNTDRLPKRFGSKPVGFGKDSSGKVMSAAAGAYQFMPSTLKELIKKGTLKPDEYMTPDTQDKAGWALMKDRGVTLKALRISGLSRGIMDKMSPEWASFPTLSGKSFYDQPVEAPEKLKTFYDNSLKKILGNQSFNPIPTPPNTSPKISYMDLPPINLPNTKKTATSTTPSDVQDFSPIFPERRSKTSEIYGLRLG